MTSTRAALLAAATYLKWWRDGTITNAWLKFQKRLVFHELRPRIGQVTTRTLDALRFLALRVRQRTALVTLPAWGDWLHQVWRAARCWPRSLRATSGWKFRLAWDELKHRTVRLSTRILATRLLSRTLQKLPLDELIHWTGAACTRAQESTRSISGMVCEWTTLVMLLPWGDVTPRIHRVLTSATYRPRSLGRTVHQWTSRVAWDELRHRTHEAWASTALIQNWLALTVRERAWPVWSLAWHELTDWAGQVSAGTQRTKVWLSGTAQSWARQWSWWHVGFGVAGLVLSGSVGVLVAVALTWPSVAKYGFGPGRVDNLSVTSPQIDGVRAAQSGNTSVSTSLAATPGPILTPVTIGAAPVPTALIAAAPPPTPDPSPTVEPSAAEVWATVAPALDAAWGADTETTVRLLDNFLARFPDYAPAEEKLYAALLSRANELSDAGDTSGAADQAQRAASLLPDRPEASLFLDSLGTPASSPSSSTDDSTDSTN